ncbi:DUF5710 domain-containing protein [Rhizobium sp. RAF56]|uniref:DUF5710 domain-containing protein n=1 Tax=Rhizobium sp. RAF56 TaxID=3233062 RepID=UPI003F9C534D
MAGNFSDQNIFEMYEANGGPDFWIRRTTWSHTCARIIRIGPFTKPGPYFGNPSALMDVYSLDGELKDELAPVPVAGTYKTWRRIEAPAWVESMPLRSLDDPAIGATLAALDKKRGKGPGGRFTAQAEGERVMLTVPFARRDEAKKLGARWSPTDKSWWLLADNASALAEARALGLLSDDA